MKLLLPLDVANSYRECLDELECLVPLKDADVFLLYAAESVSALESILTSMGKIAQQMDGELKKRAQSMLDEVGENLKNRCKSVISQVVEGSAALTIEKMATSDGFDLIAMGATQPHANPFYVLGSTAAHVVKHAQGTILILRQGVKDATAPVKALIAVDGSPTSLNAVRKFATQFAASGQNVSVTLLTVVSIVGIWKFVAPVEFIASIEDNLNMAAETILAEADKVLSEYGITPADMIIRSGEPANEIIKAGKDIQADLIVVGAQGRSTVEHLFLGSVSHKLSLHSPCSTVVVK